MNAPMEYITDAVKGIVKISSPIHSLSRHLFVELNKLAITYAKRVFWFDHIGFHASEPHAVS